MEPVTKNLGKIMMTMEGEYNPEREYEVLSVVSFENISYISKKNVPINIPVTNTEYWQFFGSLGNTPKLRKNIETKYIEVSYDNGEHWNQLIALFEITGHQGIQGVQGPKGEPAVAIENYITAEATLETIDVTDILSSVGSADTVYRVSNWDGIQYNETTYSEYGWYNNAYKKLATRQIGIDNEPIINSQNLVKSGGIQKETSLYSNFITRIDLSSYTPANGYIKSDGIWDGVDSVVRKHIVIPTTDLGNGEIEIFCNCKENQSIAQFSSYNPVNGTSDLTPNTSRIYVAAGTVYKLKLLPTTTYLYIQISSGSKNLYPEQIVINDPVLYNKDSFVFKGIAETDTIPDIQAGSKCCYLTKNVGTYTNFGINVTNHALTLLLYNGSSWSQTVLMKPKVRIVTDSKPNINTSTHKLDLGENPIVILETPTAIINILLYDVLDNPATYRAISLIPSSGRYSNLLFDAYNIQFVATTRSNQNITDYEYPIGVYDTTNPKGCSRFDFPVTFDGYVTDLAHISGVIYDTVPTQNSNNLLRSTAVRESERKLNEFILGNTTGDITKCLHFTNGTASTASNVASYGAASRIISDFIACNQHENTKLVITNASTNPKFDILVGKQKGTNNFESEQPFTGGTTIEVNLNGSDRDRLYILLRDHDNTSGAISPSDINGISVAIKDSVTPVDPTDILVLNPEVEVQPKIINCTRPYRVNGSAATRNCLSLLHFSDLHADNDNLDRINRFATKYSSYINDIIQTGDLFNYLNGLPSSYALNTNIINTIGNHEARYKVDNEYVYPTTLELYNLIYKDYISQWNVTQPSDAATDGKCYFYKDYALVNVRMIVLDCMHYDTIQLTWLEGVLSDALTNNYHVIIATHISPFDTVKDVNNPFSSLDYSPGNAGGVQSGPEPLVKSFINNGGHFICYLCGHIHDDYMGVSTNSDYNNQLVVGVGSASLFASKNYSSMGRIAGDKTQDCFNILSIDTQTSTIKLMRIGADYDRYMRHKGVLSWNYSTSQLIHCE